MKLNSDCIRDILITVETMDYGAVCTLPMLCEKLCNYSEEELNYHCLQLIDAGFLNAKAINTMGSTVPQVWRIFDLTFPSHQFLSDIRSETTWSKTKDIAKSVGSESLHALKDIAVGVVTSTIQSKLGLP